MYQLPELVNAYNYYICYLSMYDRQGIIDLTSVRFFYPTTLLPLITFIKKNNCKYKEPADPNASNYLKLAIVEGEYPDKLDPASSYIPPISLPHTEKGFNDITTEKLLGYLHGWFSQFNLHDILFYLISELGDNVYQHSQHSLAYIMAQRYARRNMVELSIMDDGITIAGSLGKKIPVGNDSEAVIRALKGYSSKEEKGRGFGLPTSIRIITEELRNGEVLIVSGRGLVYLKYGKEGLISDLGRRLNGTLISMRFSPEPIKSINMDLEKCIDIESYNIKKINL